MNAVKVFASILTGGAAIAAIAVMIAIPYREATNEVKTSVKFLLFIAILGAVFYTLAK